MSENRDSPEDQDFLELLSESALRDYPNPERTGCPGQQFLSQLATDRRSISLKDGRLDHVMHCSPCFGDLLAIRKNNARKQRARRIVAAGTVAAVLLVAVATWLFSRGIFRLPNINPPSGGSTALVSQLDLRNRSVTRGNSEAQGQNENLIIPRGQLSLVVLLPFGSEDGDYEVEVLRQVDHPLASGRGKATIKDGITTLRASVDTTHLEPGNYLLGLRRLHLPWTFNAVNLQ
jgi:hypothetical protein